MQTSIIDNSKIAKNTVLLYIRTLLVMFILLYTSRVILKTLGVEDYGIYNVVGGLIAMLSVISGSLSSAISRFITYEIGTGDKDKLKIIFATSKVVQFTISAIVLVVAEVACIWFLENKMQIPDGRMDAARWVLQCTLFTFCINLTSVPYNACVIAHEHMKAFAYVTLFEAVAKLGICFLIILSPIDKLVTYALLLALLSLVIRLIYVRYCRKHFEECRVGLSFDRQIFKELGGFAGWNFFNSTANMLNIQGVNMMINVFFGVTANAARGLASQVEAAVMSFVSNFTTAINPQITKSYAAGDKSGMYGLVCRGARFSYCAMLVFAVPLIVETDTILHIWLTEVPEHTVAFVRFSLVLGMLDCLGMSSYTACMATGKLKRYSLIITPIGGLEFFVSWLAFALGAPVIAAYIIYVGVKVAVLSARLYLNKTMLGFEISVFLKDVYVKIITASIIAFILPLIMAYFIQPSIIRFVAITIIGALSAAVSSFYIGMTSHERVVIIEKAKTFLSRFKQ